MGVLCAPVGDRRAMNECEFPAGDRRENTRELSTRAAARISIARTRARGLCEGSPDVQRLPALQGRSASWTDEMMPSDGMFTCERQGLQGALRFERDYANLSRRERSQAQKEVPPPRGYLFCSMCAIFEMRFLFVQGTFLAFRQSITDRDRLTHTRER